MAKEKPCSRLNMRQKWRTVSFFILYRSKIFFDLSPQNQLEFLFHFIGKIFGMHQRHECSGGGGRWWEGKIYGGLHFSLPGMSCATSRDPRPGTWTVHTGTSSKMSLKYTLELSGRSTAGRFLPWLVPQRVPIVPLSWPAGNNSDDHRYVDNMYNKANNMQEQNSHSDPFRSTNQFLVLGNLVTCNTKVWPSSKEEAPVGPKHCWCRLSSVNVWQAELWESWRCKCNQCNDALDKQPFGLTINRWWLTIKNMV